MITVLIADDQELVRAGFRAMLDAEDDIEVVAEAVDGSDAVEQARLRKPQVVLMDIRMPHVDGIEATRRLTSRGQSAPSIVVLTTFDVDEYVWQALRAGASGFLLKDIPRDRLAGGIRTVAAGEALLAPAVTRRLIEHYVRRPTPNVATSEAFSEVTDRELEVFRLVARGLSNAEISEALYVSQGTVKTHVSRILSKLDLRDRVQAVTFAYESGLVQPGGTSACEAEPDAD
jgi:DNA-binding NarL/FixJ family response regulator